MIDKAKPLEPVAVSKDLWAFKKIFRAGLSESQYDLFRAISFSFL
jgi:hypothetical protein